MKKIVTFAIILSTLLFACTAGKTRTQTYSVEDASAVDAGVDAGE